MAFRFFVLSLLFFLPLNASYVHRHTALAEHGRMTFTGNTLGLSKKRNESMAGISDAIGAFSTTDIKEKVGDFPKGTTLDYRKNSSSAVLVIPEGSTILYAELIWMGSYGYYRSGEGEDPNKVLIPANGPIKLKTPKGVVHEITSDPVTRQNVQNSNPNIKYSAGNYCRSQEVTAIIKGAGAGTYTVGGVPSTITPWDNNHNAAGWTLAVIYRHPNLEINNMTLFVGCEQSSSPSNAPVEVSGFVTPPDGTLSGRLLVCGIEGDANKTGDHMAFGPTVGSMSFLSGPNNGIDNFFASQINGDDGKINTSGTFGLRNHVPPNRMSAGRQGIDITNVDCSGALLHGQTSAFAQGITNVGGEDFTISGLGIQIRVEAPVINPVKKVNGKDSIASSVGDTVKIDLTMKNSGSVIAHDVILKDVLEKALIPIPGTCRVNGKSFANPNYTTGIPLGDLAVNQTATVSFDLLIEGMPKNGNAFHNIASVEYSYQINEDSRFAFARISSADDLEFENFSNLVTIVLPSPFAPQSFQGKFSKCKFINKTEYTISTSWLPPTETGVLFYRIYYKDRVIGEVSVNEPRRFTTCLDSKSQGKKLEIAAVYENFAESVHVPIQIID